MTDPFDFTTGEDSPILSDRPFNPWRRSWSPEVGAIIDEAGKLVETYECRYRKRQRKRPAAARRTFREAIEAILCDVMQHHLSGSQGGIYVPRSNKVLGMANRYHPPVLGKTFPHVLDLLSAPEMAYIQQMKGHAGFEDHQGIPRRTTITAGSRLLRRIEDRKITLHDLQTIEQSEVLILKSRTTDFWDESARIDYKDTARTRRLRQQVQTINRWLCEADIDFDPAAIEDSPPVIDIHDRAMRRVFTQGSFSSGGRLFGGFFQQMKKRHRLNGLLIDEEEGIELDYGQMSPRIIYGMCKAEPDQEDLYALPGYEDHRAGIKKIMNAMLFSTKPLNRFPRGLREKFMERHRIADVCEAIMTAHAPIKHLFCRGIGHKAQFIESEVMVDVLLTLRDKGITALPIHDAIIIGNSHEEEATEVMLSRFQHHADIDGRIAVERGTLFSSSIDKAS